MKTEEVLIVGAVAVAVYLIVKYTRTTAPTTQQPQTVWYSDYNYQNDQTGALFSASGADVRARR